MTNIERFVQALSYDTLRTLELDLEEKVKITEYEDENEAGNLEMFPIDRTVETQVLEAVKEKRKHIDHIRDLAYGRK